jgi:uncharacterized protein (DUF433 family)
MIEAGRQDSTMVRELTLTETDKLITQYIGPHPSNRGTDEYWLKESGIPVWAIIDSMQANYNDADDVATLYHISREEVEAAWAFYLRHRAVIDNRLAKSDADE